MRQEFRKLRVRTQQQQQRRAVSKVQAEPAGARRSVSEQLPSESSQQLTTDVEPERRVTAFVAMPFAKEYEPLYGAIRQAALQAGVTPLRADESLAPGPIVNQIFDALGAADCVVAEIGSRNPNVYYEVALAHCIQKPSILLVRKDRVDAIPFDVRHNRVIIYEDWNLPGLVEELTKTLTFVKQTFVLGQVAATLDDHLRGLVPAQEPEEVLSQMVQEIGHEFGLTNPRLQEQTALPEGGYAITIVDEFAERVVFQIDVNGNIRRKKKLN